MQNALKVCTMCGEAKPLSEFFANKTTADGLQFHCKLCHRAVQKRYRQRHPERVKESDERWRDKDAKHARSLAAKRATRWREENPKRAQEIRAKHAANLRLRTVIKKLEQKLADAQVTEKTCSLCGITKPLSEFHKSKRGKYGVRGDCKSCHLPLTSQIQARRYEKERDVILAYNKARRTHTGLRTPAWADQQKIRAIYAEAQRLTRETGVKHHVDHVVPLRSKVVQGLHCEANLVITTASQNAAKGNRTWPDMP